MDFRAISELVVSNWCVAVVLKTTHPVSVCVHVFGYVCFKTKAKEIYS